MISRARQWTVLIDVQAISTWPRGDEFTERSSGTGIIISSDGMIATNAHVIADARSIIVTLEDGSRPTATVIGTDPATDLAVIHIDDTGLMPASFGDSSIVRVGDAVVTIGNALGLEGGPTATLGIVSAIERTISTSSNEQLNHMIQVDAAINSGASGGLLLSMSGEVVGITTATSTSAQSIGFAIPIQAALPILRRLIGSAR